MNEIVVAILLPVARSAGGWAQNALKDKKITKFELKKLAETVLRTGIISAMLYFGAEGFGFDPELVGTTAAAIIVDMVLSALKETNNVTRR